MANGFETIGWILTARDLASKPLAKATEFMQQQANKTRGVFSQLSDEMTEHFGTGGTLDRGLDRVNKGFLSIFDTTGGRVLTRFGSNVNTVFDKAIARSRSLVVATGEVFSKLNGMEDVLGGIKKAGGVGGALLGPLGPLLNLFTPLIRMFTKQFTPAIETFAAIVETAFGPFSETLEIIARNIAFKLVPHIKPFTAFLELLAVKFGMFVEKMLEGKPDQVLTVIFKTFDDLLPVLMKTFEVLVKVGMEVGESLLKSFIKLAPLVVKTFSKLLKVLLPVIPPLTRLAVTLLERVFVPILIKIIQIMEKDLEPMLKFMEEWLPAIAIMLDDTAKKVDKFFGNLGKYADAVKFYFVDPVMDYLKPLIEGIKGVAQLFQETVQSVGDGTDEAAAAAERARHNARLHSTKIAKEANVTGLTGQERRRAFDAFLRKRKGMADGGVVTGPVSALIGEGRSNELVLPLEKQVIERTLAPLMPSMEFKQLDKLVTFGEELIRAMRTGIKIDTRGMAAPQEDRSRLNSGVGMFGGGGF